jgi:hypothetical protein
MKDNRKEVAHINGIAQIGRGVFHLKNKLGVAPILELVPTHIKLHKMNKLAFIMLQKMKEKLKN